MKSLSTLVLAALLPAAQGWAKEPTLKDQRLSACYEDMQRLCPGEPTKAKLKTCIRPNLARVAPACKAWMDKVS